MIRATEGKKLLRQAVREHVFPVLSEAGFARVRRAVGEPGSEFALERQRKVDGFEVIERFGFLPQFHRLDTGDGIHIFFSVKWPAICEVLREFGYESAMADNPQVSVSLSDLKGGTHWNPLFVHVDFDAAALGEQLLAAWNDHISPFANDACHLTNAAERFFTRRYGAVAPSPAWISPVAYLVMGDVSRAMDEWVVWRWSEHFDWMAKGRGDGAEQALYEEFGASLASLQD